MEATDEIVCRPIDAINPMIATSFQVACILVVSHIFHLLLKPLGQPGPVAQLLAGIVVGPSLLSRIDKVKEFFLQASSAKYYQFFSLMCRILFMFSIGLETDVAYLWRNLRVESTIAGGGSILAIILGASVSWFLIHALKVVKSYFSFVLFFIAVLANSASPVVIRLVSELKFETSQVGRLAIYSSLINEMYCIFVVSLIKSFSGWRKIGNAVLTGSSFVLIIFLNKYFANWFNKRNLNNIYLTNSEAFVILFLLVSLSIFMEWGGFSSIMICFLLGMLFPREGKTFRTLMQKLSYTVNTFIVPVYLGYTGFQFDVSNLGDKVKLLVIALTIVLSTACKIAGTLAACYYLKIPWNDGKILSFALNLKGNFDLVLLNVATSAPDDQWWTPEIHSLFLTIIVLDTIILGPVVACLLNNEKVFSMYHSCLETIHPDTELRLICCVYSPRHVSGHFCLISALSGSSTAPITPYLMHLVELPKKKKTKLMYHQLEDGGQFSDEEDYGKNDALEINDAIDSFTSETKIMLRQGKVVSVFSNIYEDVCNGAEDLRSSIILLPFHKHQRIDGQLEGGKVGIRTTNQKVLRHAPCSVGIFVDRSQTGFQQPHGSQSVQNIATLFFGGPDDREALACSKRVALHAQARLTVVRFLHSAAAGGETSWINNASHKNEEVIMAISNQGTETEIDNAVIESFKNSFVSTGKVGYVEKYVNDGVQTATVLREIGDMYNLFIVGRGGRGHCPLTTGMSDWEECPELGLVGDLLASSDMNINSSVLVIQRHRGSETDTGIIDD
ncbi:hypothetical protein SLE2022_024400 [Rubroshorea leprosula]